MHKEKSSIRYLNIYIFVKPRVVLLWISHSGWSRTNFDRVSMQVFFLTGFPQTIHSEKWQRYSYLFMNISAEKWVWRETLAQTQDMCNQLIKSLNVKVYNCYHKQK